MKSSLSFLFASMFLFTAFAQPSESELKNKVNAYYGDVSFIHKIEFESSKLEKRWVKDNWRYYWSRKYIIEGKTDYPGVYQIIYGGVQYLKNGASYSFDNILTGGAAGYIGIPDPNPAEINTHLKATFDPLSFYGNYKMNYLISAPNTIVLAEDPNWKWTNLNEVKCNVVSKYTVLSNDIGGVQDKQGTFRIKLKRSVDGANFDADAGLLKSGKWLPLEKGSESNPKVLKSYTISKEDLANTKTFAQQYAVRHAEEFKKSLAIVEMPDFDNSNHLMQFVHELLIEGDEAKVTAFCYQMFPSYLFEEWSEIVLNQNGQEKLEGILKDLQNYKNAFCKHPIIKEIRGTYVRFYDRNKKRMNNISVTWENERWYVMEMSYYIGQEDLAEFEKNQEDNCGENPIYLDVIPQFKTGDKVEMYHRGNWIDAEILKPQMNKGGYSVKYGSSGLTEWKYVSEIRASGNTVVEETQLFKEFEIGQKVKAKYTNVWYDGTILKVSYESEEYLVDIPERNIDTWINNQDIVDGSEKTETDGKTEKKETGKTKKTFDGLKNKLKSKVPNL